MVSGHGGEWGGFVLDKYIIRGVLQWMYQFALFLRGIHMLRSSLRLYEENRMISFQLKVILSLLKNED